jgi:hypothetical protein
LIGWLERKADIFLAEILLSVPVIVASHLIVGFILYRRQHRKPFACPPQAQCIGIGGFFHDGINARR